MIILVTRKSLVTHIQRKSLHSLGRGSSSLTSVPRKSLEVNQLLKLMRGLLYLLFILYNLAAYQLNQRLSSLILLIALAYSCAIIQGQKIKTIGLQKYVGRVTECGRSIRRHSSFWIGLLVSMLGRALRRELEWNLVKMLLRLLMRIRRNKLPFFQRGLRAMSFILSMF
jgi:hypothetical protein